MGSVNVIAIEPTASWDATVDVSSSVVRVRVTGAAATNIDWYLQTAEPVLGSIPKMQHTAVPAGCSWSV